MYYYYTKGCFVATLSTIGVKCELGSNSVFDEFEYGYLFFKPFQCNLEISETILYICQESLDT